jgi:hypothetical protein
MSEQIRIAQLLDQAKVCNASVALDRARRLYGTQSYCPAPVLVGASVQKDVAVGASCYAFVRPQPLTAGAYTNRLHRGVLDAEVSSDDATTRFKEFNRFFPAPCPVVGADYLNASMPKASTACPLPNSLLNPVLPA